MTIKILCRALAAILSAIALTACGLTAPKSNDGYADLDSPGVFDTDLTMKLSIGPALLHFAAKHVEDDPETKAILSDLQGVRVRIYEVDGDAMRVAERLDTMNASLREQHWEPVIQVRELTERTHVLMKLQDNAISGLTVLSSDGTEVVLVNVMGDLHPEMFGEVMSTLGVEAAQDLDSI